MEQGRKRVVVTGATGFLGSAVARALVAAGMEVHALTRPTSNLRRVSDLPITWHVGDVTDPASLGHIFDDADWVIHAAGQLGQAGISESTYWQQNAQGTYNVLAEIAAGGGMPRVVCISSAGVLGPMNGFHPESVPDETFPLRPSNGYERSKAGAEMIAATFAEQGLPVIIARPEFVYGPGDLHVLGLFQAIQKRLFFYVGNGRNTCHPTYIDDTVDGLLRCLHKGRVGEIYHLSGPRPVPFRELAETIAAELGVRPPRLAFPRSLVWGGAAGAELIMPRLGHKPPLSRTGVAFFSENRRSAFDKAQRDLGYVPRVDLAQGVAESVAWYRMQGLLPPAT
jgi:dihydroflavonol-4-reductase